jgi:protein TonB
VSTTPTTPPGQSATPERRSTVRRKLGKLVYLDLGGNNGGNLLAIGEGGLTCQVIGTLTPGERCKSKFTLPGTRRPIEANCLVIWTNPTRKGGGLKFIDLPDDTRALIRNWILRDASAPATRKVVVAAKMNPINLSSGPSTMHLKPAATKPISPAPPQALSQAPTRSTIEAPQAERTLSPSPAPLAPAKAQEPTISASATVSAIPPINRMISPLSVPSTAKSTGPIFRIVIAACVVIALGGGAFYFGQQMGLSRKTYPTQTVSVPQAEIASPQSPVDSAPPAAQDVAPTAAPAITPDANTAPAAEAQVPTTTISAPIPTILPAGPVATNPVAPARKPAMVTKIAPKVEKSKPVAAPFAGTLQRPHLASRIDLSREPQSLALAEVAMPTAVATIDPRGFTVGTLSAPAPPKPLANSPANAAFQGPVLRRRVEPAYSAVAKAAGVEGTVEVAVTIGKDGVPHNISAIKGDPRLSPLAVEAISRWRYKPAKFGGNPVEAPIVITIEFQINH